MAKQRHIPTLSTYDIVNNDVGDITNYNDVNKIFDVSNITTSNVRNVLGESNNNVGQLCQSANINEYALFRPESSSPPYNLGDFGGYNHEAKAPAYFNNPYSALETTWGNQGGGVYGIQLNWNLRRGERWPFGLDYESWGRVKIKLTMNPAGYPSVEFWSEMDDVQNLNIGATHVIDITYSNISISGTMSVEAWYCNEAGAPIQLIEDVHPDFNFTINQSTVPISLSDFDGVSGYSGFRMYYTNGSTIDYISYDFKTYEVGDLEFSVALTGGVSVNFPLIHPNNNTLFVSNTGYVSHGGLLYRLEMTGFSNTITINGVLRGLDGTLASIFQSSNITTVGGYPTTPGQL
jgi:hypothetical protein